MKDNSFLPKSVKYFLSSIDSQKNSLVPIRPDRYLYHFTKGGIKCQVNENLYYQRLSIYRYGLYGKDNGTSGVWANRQITQLTSTYPILLDGFEWGNEEYLEGLEGYDVWRIDTHRINNKWYLDPNMQDMPFLCDNHDYVYTENSIPAFALKLFNIKVDEVHFYLYPKERVKFELISIKVR